MELNDVLSMVEDQDRGRWFPLLHPVTGNPTGMRFKVAGPDSRVQAKSLAIMTDELAEMADEKGRVSGEDREKAARQMLARCILDWEVKEGGEPVPFTHERCLRVLAVAWVRVRADAMASDRRVYFQPAGGADAAA